MKKQIYKICNENIHILDFDRVSTQKTGILDVNTTIPIDQHTPGLTHLSLVHSPESSMVVCTLYQYLRLH